MCNVPSINNCMFLLVYVDDICELVVKFFYARIFNSKAGQNRHGKIDASLANTFGIFFTGSFGGFFQASRLSENG